MLEIYFYFIHAIFPLFSIGAHISLHLITMTTMNTLGSWGDNELSPECLDGARDFLKADGVSIPSSYTSFVGDVQHSMCMAA